MEYSIEYEQSSLEIWKACNLFKNMQPDIKSHMFQGNRIIDQERVDVIANRIKEKPGIFDGTQVHFALHNKKYIILDGQHRLSALEQIAKESHEFLEKLHIEVKVYSCDTKEDMTKKFIELNDNHVPVPKKYIRSNSHTICSSVSAMLLNYFPKTIFSNSYNCNRPQICLKRLEEVLSNQTLDWE